MGVCVYLRDGHLVYFGHVCLLLAFFSVSRPYSLEFAWPRRNDTWDGFWFNTDGCVECVSRGWRVEIIRLTCVLAFFRTGVTWCSVRTVTLLGTVTKD